MERPYVRYGHQIRYFDTPSNWKILTLAAFHDHPPVGDIAQRTKAALESPTRSAPLKKRISSQDTVAVLIEDQTRSSPKEAILRALLDVLDEAGVPRENISVIIALGTHRALTAQELESYYGNDLVENYAFINHDCLAPDLVPVGKLKTGTPVKINKIVHEATFKIGIGSIFPHPMNGFGGGGKILFPGVANFEAILEHHLKYSFRDRPSLGILEENPFHEEICRLAEKGGLDFIINSVLDHNDHLSELVCGDPVEAHLAGTERCKEIISKNFEKRADLTVISAFPYSAGTQLMKPLEAASMITKEGGVIVLVGQCTVPFSDFYLKGCERFRLKYKGQLKEKVLSHFSENRRILEDGAPELNMSLAQALLAQDRFKVILVSEEVPKEHSDRLGFLYANDLYQAFDKSADLIPAGPDVHIVPSGGVILPVLQQ